MAKFNVGDEVHHIPSGKVGRITSPGSGDGFPVVILDGPGEFPAPIDPQLLTAIPED